MSKPYHQQAAEMIDGREYRDEIDELILGFLKEHGLIAIYGASDDLMIMNGTWGEDELYRGTGFTRSGILQNECEDDNCPYFSRLDSQVCHVKWQISWEGYTHIFEPLWPSGELMSPNLWSSFEIFEDGDKYCRGFVIPIYAFPEI